MGYSDSDLGGDRQSCSTTGYCFILTSDMISWSSKKQPTIALSSTKARYRTACSAMTKAVWLKRIRELCAPQSSSTFIW